MVVHRRLQFSSSRWALSTAWLLYGKTPACVVALSLATARQEFIALSLAAFLSSTGCLSFQAPKSRYIYIFVIVPIRTNQPPAYLCTNYVQLRCYSLVVRCQNQAKGETPASSSDPYTPENQHGPGSNGTLKDCFPLQTSTNQWFSGSVC